MALHNAMHKSNYGEEDTINVYNFSMKDNRHMDKKKPFAYIHRVDLQSHQYLINQNRKAPQTTKAMEKNLLCTYSDYF